MNINNKVIVSPLDWGLGHATRCIPIIKVLLQKGYQPIIAGTPETIALIQLEFKNLAFCTLPSYNIAYHTLLGSKRLYLLSQIFKLKKVIATEHNILSNYCLKHNIKFIISDNRYGIYLPNCRNVFITHQLKIATGFGKYADAMLQKWHYRFLKPFSEIWIPDVLGSPNLSGNLSHTKLPKKPVHFIGALSRLSFTNNITKKYHFAFIASGPEPFKSIFIQQAIQLVTNYNYPIIIVAGNMQQKKIQQKLPPHITFLQYANAGQMQAIFNQTTFIICRSGYSSIMDAAATQAKCIMLPTPSQTEQLYLANYLGRQQLIKPIKNLNITLNELYLKANNFNLYI